MQLGRLTKVTRARLERRDHYRAQLNVDRRFWAYGYGALYKHYGQRKASAIRDHLAKRVQADIERYFQKSLRDDPDFAGSIPEFLKEFVDDDLRADAKTFLVSLGWTPNRKRSAV